MECTDPPPLTMSSSPTSPLQLPTMPPSSSWKILPKTTGRNTSVGSGTTGMTADDSSSTHSTTGVHEQEEEVVVETRALARQLRHDKGNHKQSTTSTAAAAPATTGMSASRAPASAAPVVGLEDYAATRMNFRHTPAQLAQLRQDRRSHRAIVITETNTAGTATTAAGQPEDRVDKALRKFWGDQQAYASVGEVARYWHHLVLIHHHKENNDGGDDDHAVDPSSASSHAVVQTVPGYRLANVMYGPSHAGVGSA